MSLATLPLVGFRLIAARLDLESLGKLFATFNYRMQYLLSSPKLLPFVIVSDLHNANSSNSLYLLKYLRSVKRLKISLDSKLTRHLLSSGSILNLDPVEVYATSEILFSTIPRHPSTEAQQDGSIPQLDSLSPGSPLLHSFKRLTTIVLDCTTIASKDAEAAVGLFPSTLTSISLLGTPPPVKYLEILPKTLKSLSLLATHESRSFHTDWTMALSHLDELETLIFYWKFLPSFLCSTADCCFPASLQVLKFLGVLADQSFFNALTRMLPSCPHLHTLSIDGGDRFRTNFTVMGPLGITRPESLLHLAYHTKPWWHIADIINIPPRLVSLSITVFEHWNELVSALITHKTLESLRLVSHGSRGFVLGTEYLTSDERTMPDAGTQCAADLGGFRPSSHYQAPLVIPGLLLPRSLLRLEFDNNGPMDRSEIQCLPSQLRFLGVSRFFLSQHSELLNRAPQCRLSIVTPVNIWRVENAKWCTEGDMAQYWDPATIDLTAWISALKRKRAQMDILCAFDLARDANIEQIQFPQTLKSLSFGLTEFIRIDLSSSLGHAAVECPELQQVSLRTFLPLQLPARMNSLTHLELYNSPIGYFGENPHLKHLSSTVAFRKTPKREIALLRSLTHLDVPNWKLKWQSIAGWNFDNLKMLRFTLTDVADFKVVEFLTKRLTPQVRLNTSLAIEYFVTGSLLPESGPKATRHVTWTSMVEETDVILKSQLSNRMPSGFNLSRQDTSHTAALQDTVGSCVTSLTQVPRKGFYLSQIVLPRSSHSIQLDTGLPLQMTNSKRSQECFGALEPSFSDDDNERDCRLTPIFGHSIVLLDVSNVTRLSQWIPCLPPTLKHLSFSPAYEESCGFIVNCNFPPSLITLIIRWRHEKPFDILAPFKRHQHIPRSLEHLALRAKYFPYYNRQTDFPSSEEDSSELPANASLLLPNLKTLYLPIVSQRCLDYYWNKVSSPTLERFIITTDGFVAPKTDKYSGKLLIETSPKSLITEMLAKMHLDGIVASNSSSSSAPSITAPTLFDANPTTPTVLSPFSSTSSLETQFGGIKLSNNETSSTSGFGTPTSSIASQFASSASPSILDNNPSGATQTTRKKAVRRK